MTVMRAGSMADSEALSAAHSAGVLSTNVTGDGRSGEVWNRKSVRRRAEKTVVLGTSALKTESSAYSRCDRIHASKPLAGEKAR